MLWDFGRLVQSRHGDVAIRAFSELLKQEPARVDVRLELADAQLRFGSPADALTTLVGIRAVTPSDAPRYSSHRHLRPPATWRSQGCRRDCHTLPRRRQDRRRSRRCRTSDGRGSETNRQAFACGCGSYLAARRFRGITGSLSAPSGEAHRNGEFVELDCRAKQPHMVVETDGSRKSFLIDDPGTSSDHGQGDVEVELVCGPQKKRPKWKWDTTSRPLVKPV